MPTTSGLFSLIEYYDVEIKEKTKKKAAELKTYSHRTCKSHMIEMFVPVGKTASTSLFSSTTAFKISYCFSLIRISGFPNLSKPYFRAEWNKSTVVFSAILFLSLILRSVTGSPRFSD